MSGVIVSLFPDSDTEVKVHPVNDKGRRIVAIRVHDSNCLQFHDLPDAFAWLAKVTADLYEAAYPDTRPQP